MEDIKIEPMIVENVRIELIVDRVQGGSFTIKLIPLGGSGEIRTRGDL